MSVKERHLLDSRQLHHKNISSEEVSYAMQIFVRGNVQHINYRGQSVGSSTSGASSMARRGAETVHGRA
jgi:hypothetical protein